MATHLRSMPIATEKIILLMGTPCYFSEELTESLAAKLSWEQIRQMRQEIGEEKQGYLRRWCRNIVDTKRLLKQRSEALENMAKEIDQ